jgi:hypothetical protein
MITRRTFVFAFAEPFLFAMAPAMAAPPVVEILAMPHPPVKMALAPLREWLATRQTKLKLMETDVESPAGEKRLSVLGLRGHIPIVIVIDNQYRHQRQNGSPVEFVNFPKIPGASIGVRGEWTAADVEAIVEQKMHR